jgi:hypothetical protein
MRQIVTPWESFLGEIHNFAHRLREMGHEEFFDAIMLADERQDIEELQRALLDINRIYHDEEEEIVRDVASALEFRSRDVNRNHVDYHNGIGEWLPSVPYGLSALGLTPMNYDHEEGHLLFAWAFPGAPVSEKYGPILLTYDYLESESGAEFTGMRVFFQESSVHEPLESLVDEDGEIIISPFEDAPDIAVYKCIIPDDIENSIQDTINIIRDSLFMDDTLEILEAAVFNKVILKTFPHGEKIPNVF